MTTNDERVQRFVDLRAGGVAPLSGLDRPEHFLDEVTVWCRGERRLGDPVSAEELVRMFVGLSRAQKDGEQALARLAAVAVQRFVSTR
ncbi:hypothetical protein [Mycobacterium paraense]|uniref:hypothetical protein n=1 Tax=Mycobacterium paraense TaxID=767916 RepID=UPI00111C5937|nr:hypothetical protein [Mycobacterium paraense]